MPTTNTTTSRPRMAAVYAPGTVRGHRLPSGWTARADLTDMHPITGRSLPRAACRVVDHRDEGIAVIPAPAPASRRGADEYENPGAAVAAPGTEAKLPEHHAPPPAPRGKRRR